MTLKSDVEFEEKLTCGLENDMRNLVDFYQSSRKSRRWDSFIQSRKVYLRKESKPRHSV